MRKEIDALDVSNLNQLRGITEAMPYLYQCFKEGARLYGLVAFFRVATTDVPYGKYVIPKGRNVFLIPYNNHHDAESVPSHASSHL